MTDRTCACGSAITKHSKTGQCRPCAARRIGSDPAAMAKRGAKLSALHRQPAFKARFAEGVRRGAAKRFSDPEQLEFIRRLGREVGALNVGSCHTPEANANRRAALVPWCPPELLDLNTELRKKDIPQAERKRMIREMVPGTDEHAKRHVANQHEAGLIRDARRRAQEY